MPQTLDVPVALTLLGFAAIATPFLLRRRSIKLRRVAKARARVR